MFRLILVTKRNFLRDSAEHIVVWDCFLFQQAGSRKKKKKSLLTKFGLKSKADKAGGESVGSCYF